MKKQDILSIFITGTVGFMIGAYLYLTQFAGFWEKDVVPTESSFAEFSVTGEMYGGCRNSCSSFQILKNGTYRYLYSPTVGADPVVRQGNLPIALKRDLSKSLLKSELVAQSKATNPKSCNSHSDGIDARYTITVDGKEYLIDSCGTAVDGEGAIWLAFNEIWKYLQTYPNN
ncbi:hypothetical protein KC926_01940 [Candidatus Kaiserbacteria bacterium]|nr:hypothetical protein [Candidatus Kaiserbacteria bacterium]